MNVFGTTPASGGVGGEKGGEKDGERGKECVLNNISELYLKAYININTIVM
jgi:hypothetical protein